MSSARRSITLDQSSQETSNTVTAPSIGKAATGSLLVRAIMETYGKEILESASEQFLDLALEVRLQTISTSELVKLLAKANRLGYQETDAVDDENGACAHPVQGANANSRSKPDAIGTGKSPGAIAGQINRPVIRPYPATPSQPLSLEKTRAPNHTNTAQILRDEPFSANTHLNAQKVAPSAKEGDYSIQNMQGVAGIQEEASSAAGTAGKQGQRECSRTRSGPQVAAHVAWSRHALKRTQAQDMGGGVQSQRPRKLARAPARKSSLSISAQPLAIVIISDSEPEPEGNDGH
ncbi:hypothetical protein OIDMADRAFT_27538 [Oidiodendron maius Zn]|uniref:Uncharacterized protein n=1 Tax=Oidiodendron maius (strain Zn) TaxID=913774 RepID=A0A0C3DM22_OIDMZ|nr:hypothetical protein OIDMADRAFT_27538 [Oidiodendron maius Zn]